MPYLVHAIFPYSIAGMGRCYVLELSFCRAIVLSVLLQIVMIVLISREARII